MQKDLYKKLTSLEFEVKEQSIRKRITELIDKVYNLQPTNNDKVFEIYEELLRYINELKKEMINPIIQIINNYLDKIDSLINSIKLESEV